LPYLLKRRHRQNNLFSLPSQGTNYKSSSLTSHTYILSLTNHPSHSSFVPLLSHPSPSHPSSIDPLPSSLFPLTPLPSFLSLSPIPYFDSWFLSQHLYGLSPFHPFLIPLNSYLSLHNSSLITKEIFSPSSHFPYPSTMGLAISDQKNYSAEDWIDRTIGLFRWNSGCSACADNLTVACSTC
jgi:hypothetical protein